MEGKRDISQYRDRLDTTLASHDLSNVESLKALVENQMSKPSQSEDQEISDKLVQKRTKEVANFLSMLRSASVSDDEGSKTKEIPHGSWKIKEDNQDCRVMYREGPAGTPFHTLLVEGYVDGPVDNCLCISWESRLYPKWWPQFNIPTFKVVSSECLQKIRTGEQISLVRMKLSWPLSMREALVHYVTFEYFQDDLIIVLWNTISDVKNINISTHGFTGDGIPAVQNVTRIDIIGGLALQKVTADRSYFRAIVNMDLKLDFVPPAFINFVSRQLLGSGFKLYKKEVASSCKGDADFGKALKEPFYTRIHEALYSENNLPNGNLKQEEIKIDNSIQSKEHLTREIEIEETETLDENDNIKKSNEHQINGFVNDCQIIRKNKMKVAANSEVEEALGTLEKVIFIFREYRFNPRSVSLSGFAKNMFPNLENYKAKHLEESVNGLSENISQEEDVSSSRDPRWNSLCSDVKVAAGRATVPEKMAANGRLDESTLIKEKTSKQRSCCFKFK